MRQVVLAFLTLFASLALGGAAKPEIALQLGHRGFTVCAALSPDGKRLLTGGWSGEVKLWEVASGREIRTLKGDGTNVTGLAFSPDGLRAATYGLGSQVVLWDLVTGEALHTWKTAGDYTTPRLSFVAQGRQLMVAETREVHIYDAVGGGELASWKLGADPSDMTVSPDGRFLLVRPVDPGPFTQASRPAARILDLRSSAVIGQVPEQARTYVAFSADGTRAFSAWGDGEVALWETFTGRTLWVAGRHASFVRSVHLSADGRIALSCDQALARVWDARTGRPLQVFSLAANLHLAVLSRDGRRALFESGFGGAQVLKVFDTLSGAEVASVPESQDGFMHGNLSPGGDLLLLTGPLDPVIRDLDHGAADRTFRGIGLIPCGIFAAPDGNLAAFAMGWEVALWDTAEGRRVRTFKVESPRAAALPPGGKILAAGDGKGNLHRWDLATGREEEPIPAHEGGIVCMAVSRDGTRMATGGNDALVRLWNPASGAPGPLLEGHAHTPAPGQESFTGVTALAFSPDGTRLASAGIDGTVRLWDPATGKALRVLRQEAAVYAVAFAGGADLLLTGARDGTVRLWDLAAEGGSKVVFKGEDPVRFLAAAPDGSFVAARANESKIVLLAPPAWNPVRALETDRSLMSYTSLLPAFAVTADSRRVLAADIGAPVVRAWEAGSARELARFLPFQDGEWLVLAPGGYFEGSEGGARNLNVRMGIEVASVDQFFSRFYRPELVRLALAGQAPAGGESLEEVAASRPAPEVAILAPAAGTVLEADRVELRVKVRDAGGGVGPVQVFLNGAQVANGGRGLAVAERLAPGERVLAFTIPLGEGESLIRVVASNADGSMESAPAQVKVRSRAVLARPGLQAVVVGIDRYRNASIALSHAADDAAAFGEALRKAAAPLFARVEVQVLTAFEETSREALSKALADAAAKVKPNDVFVFYDASHGVVDTVDGQDQYFLLTSNVLLLSSSHLAQDALGQADLARLLGAIPAQKKVVFLDTCNAGKGGRELQIALLQQTRGLTESTAVKLLQRSTGSAVFSASSDTQMALEGYHGHGLFTYFLLEGLRGRGGSAGDGFVTVRGLADYVEEQVVATSEQVFHRQQTPTIQTSANFPIGKAGS